MSPSANSDPGSILYLDDNLNEHLLARWAARLSSTRLCLHNFTQPSQVIQYLHRQPPLADDRCPSARTLLLLDYSLDDGLTSLDLLCWVRTQVGWQHLPVAMYSDADAPDVINRCYHLGATLFLKKPATFARMQAVFHALGEALGSDQVSFLDLKTLPE